MSPEPETPAATCAKHAGVPAVGACPRCGRFTCAGCISLDVRVPGHCVECAEAIELTRRLQELRGWQRAVLGIGLGLPAGLVVLLVLMRPDLFTPMLEHWFGAALLGVVCVLVLTQAFSFYAGFRALNRRAAQAGRNGAPGLWLAVVGLGVCTLPVLFVILFGPIVFRLVFVGVE